ncbi:HAMP domain-containing protein [Streptomyces sp. ICBB 8177]|uniref:HAMP domain-containing protein n=1 Tax=Streptomyces sp. ICBB 8177 TaxID=563922 RepID=UPI0023AEC125|nr:HAMP domain-containing protein [Streptomyces sp. ICBB 8177]
MTASAASSPEREDPVLQPADRAARRHRTRRRADMPLLGGVRPPIAALLALLLAVAAITALTLGLGHGQAVQQASRDAEAQVAADAADSVRSAVDAQAQQVRDTADAYAVTSRTTPAAALKSLVTVGTSEPGAALLDPRDGTRLAAVGEAVPLTGVDVVAQDEQSAGGPIAPRLVSGGATPRLLYFARVTLPADALNDPGNQDQGQDTSGQNAAKNPHHWLLVVSGPVSAPPVHGDGRTVRLVDRDGQVLAGTATAAQTTGAPGAATGTDLSAADRTLPETAADAANAAPRASEAFGSLLGATQGSSRTVAGWASVAPAGGKGDTAQLGLTVLTARPVPLTPAGADHAGSGLIAAGVLVLIALLVTAVLSVTVQRPLLRLHLSAARLGRGVLDDPEATGDELLRPVPTPAFGEPARIGAALESLRRQLLGEAEPRPAAARRGPGTRAVVVLCAVLVAAWSLPLLFLVNRADPRTAIPADVIADQQARTEAAADRVRDSLDQRYTDLASVAHQLSGRNADADATVLRHALSQHRQYRSLYVIDSAGAIVQRVGQTPLRTIVHTPTGSGITTVNTSGRIPSIAAYAQIPAAKNAPGGDRAPVVLFGELDVHALDGTLSRPALGSVWLTDQRYKVLAANVGFTAFQALPDSRLDRLAAGTQAAVGTAGSATSTVLDKGPAPTGDSAVAAAAPLATTGPAAGLSWRVVSSKPAAALKLTAFQVQWNTMLAGLLGLSVGVACLAWLHIVVVRPLRALAGLAERLAAGDRRTVLYPVNHDEAGSVTRGLELVRQALVARDRRSARGAVPTGSPEPADPSAPSSSGAAASSSSAPPSSTAGNSTHPTGPRHGAPRA